MDCKWSRRDYKLAKALFDFGVETVYRTPTSLEASNGDEHFTLPQQAFQCLKMFDECWLSDVIYDYENYYGKEY